MPRGIKNRADSWEVRPIRTAPYVTAPSHLATWNGVPGEFVPPTAHATGNVGLHHKRFHESLVYVLIGLSALLYHLHVARLHVELNRLGIRVVLCLRTRTRHTLVSARLFVPRTELEQTRFSSASRA